MAVLGPHEQLRQARTLRDEDLQSLSARTGLRVHHVRAIEEGRLSDLPPGIYGRAAVRSFAAAYDLDADAIVAECEPLLTRIEDPIGALARLRGISAKADPVDTTPAPALPSPSSWRPFAAASVDGGIAGALLSVASVGAALSIRVPVASLHRSAIALFVVALIFGVVYFVWLGGLAGTTLGERAVGPGRLERDPRPLTLRAIALRTWAAATADARAIHAAGAWAGRRLTPGAARSAPPTAPVPSPPPPHGRGERLTWSVSRPASVPPPPLHPRRG